MKLVFIILLCFVISSASAASILSTVSAAGSGSFARSSNIDWSGNDVGGQSISKILTAPGNFQYQTKDNTDATVNNYYNSTGYLNTDNGIIFDESLLMDSKEPDQEVYVSHSGILQNAEIDTAKYVSDTNMSIGQDAAWDGAGMYFRDIRYAVDAETTKDKVNYTYRSSGRDVFSTFTNATGGARVKPEFSFTGFEDAYIFNTSNISTGSSSAEVSNQDASGVLV